MPAAGLAAGRADPTSVPWKMPFLQSSARLFPERRVVALTGRCSPGPLIPGVVRPEDRRRLDNRGRPTVTELRVATGRSSPSRSGGGSRGPASSDRRGSGRIVGLTGPQRRAQTRGAWRPDPTPRGRGAPQPRLTPPRAGREVTSAPSGSSAPLERLTDPDPERREQ